jgi:membrane protease YdiL (CAAX protease family)
MSLVHFERGLMQTQHRYRPAAFFLLTAALSWGPWLAAAHFSYETDQDAANYGFQLLGLLGPFLSALILTFASADGALKKDFRDRLLNPRRISPLYLLVAVLIMPVATVLAILVSARFGQSGDELKLVPNLASMIPIMFLAPAFEELGWRGYGVDALRAKLGMGATTAWFAALWTIWHAPLFLINGNYQHGLLSNPVYVANFFVSVIPAAVIANWLYYKNRRFIPAAILFHFMLDAVAESFQITQFTKCFVTAAFILVALLVVVMDRKTFREGPRVFLGEALT